MNILLTCVGRRSYLVDYFKEVVAPEGKVIATNSLPDTTGMYQADKSYVVPPVNSDDYIPQLAEICKKEDIDCILSLFDIDLPYLALAKDVFEKMGIHIWVSERDVVDIANDKWKTFLFLKQNSFNVPKTYLAEKEVNHALKDGTFSFPIIVKPRWGMGSISVSIAQDLEELRFLTLFAKKQINNTYLNILSKDEMDSAVIFQEMIKGPEYGMDIFNSYDRKTLAVVSKQKLAMRSGETDSAIIVVNDELKAIGSRLGNTLQHRGNLDVDLMYDEIRKQFFVIEFNARFGGGYPFSHIAGANLPRALVLLSQGLPVSDDLFYAEPGVVGHKFILPMAVKKKV